MYVCQINEKNPTDIIKKKCMLPDNEFNDKIKELIGKKLVNEDKINQDLSSAWEVLAEPIQTVMRKHGIENPYEKLKDLTRGNEKITQEILNGFIETLAIPLDEKSRLLKLSPQNYIGIAAILAKKS